MGPFGLVGHVRRAGLATAVRTLAPFFPVTARLYGEEQALGTVPAATSGHASAVNALSHAIS
jgi:hypothetical protein